MIKLLISTAIIFTFCILGNAQHTSLVDSILNNTIDINAPNVKSRVLFPNNRIENNITKNNSSNIICNNETDIIVQLGDSIYNHNLSTNTYSYITEEIHGISSSFDVIERNNQLNLLASANWDSIYYFVDNSWNFSGYYTDSTSDLIHIGCGKNATFLMGGHLYYFNGSSDPKLIRTYINYAVADVAVDERDHAWVLTGTQWPIADTLRIIDSTGFSLCDIPFETPISTINGYGMLIHDGKAMVGFGPQNPHFSNSLVSLVIDSINNVVKFENPIPLNPEFTIDLGSCTKSINQPQCTLVNTNEGLITENTFNIFPVPFNESLTISSVEGEIHSIKLFDLFGRTLIEQTSQAENIQLNTELVPSGIYFIYIQNKDTMYQIFKIVKY